MYLLAIIIVAVLIGVYIKPHNIIIGAVLGFMPAALIIGLLIGIWAIIKTI